MKRFLGTVALLLVVVFLGACSPKQQNPRFVQGRLAQTAVTYTAIYQWGAGGPTALDLSLSAGTTVHVVALSLDGRYAKLEFNETPDLVGVKFTEAWVEAQFLEVQSDGKNWLPLIGTPVDVPLIDPFSSGAGTTY